MKLRYVLIVAAAVAGFGASLALADDGHNKGDRGKGDCKHGVVLGLANAPQSLTLTVARANDRTGFAKGQVVTVAVGAQGQQLRVIAEGCVGTDGTLTVRDAVLHAAKPKAKGDHDGTTTSSTTTTTTASTSTGSGL